jgi:hypothetical protein
VKYILFLLLNISILFSKEILQIHSINENTIILENQNSHELYIGQSGFLISNYQQIQYISASIYISKITKKYIYTEIIEKNPFKKNNLAYIKVPITLEDEAVFNIFNKKALLIAPNKQSYKKASQLINEELVSPSNALLFINKKNLNIQNLQKLTKKYLLTNFYIIYDTKLTKIDAFSLKIINTNDIIFTDTTTNKPFFTYYKYGVISKFINNIFTFNYNNNYKRLIQTIKEQ